MFQEILPRPVFHTKLQESSEKGSTQKESKDTIEKLTLTKNLVLVHLYTMIDEFIKILYNIETAKCRMAFIALKATKLTISQKSAVAFDNITIPEVNFIHDAELSQKLILKLVCNL